MLWNLLSITSLHCCLARIYFIFSLSKKPERVKYSVLKAHFCFVKNAWFFRFVSNFIANCRYYVLFFSVKNYLNLNWWNFKQRILLLNSYQWRHIQYVITFYECCSFIWSTWMEEKFCWMCDVMMSLKIYRKSAVILLRLLLSSDTVDLRKKCLSTFSVYLDYCWSLKVLEQAH